MCRHIRCDADKVRGYWAIESKLRMSHDEIMINENNGNADSATRRQKNAEMCAFRLFIVGG